jgi:hypothetical protein
MRQRCRGLQVGDGHDGPIEAPCLRSPFTDPELLVVGRAMIPAVNTGQELGDGQVGLIRGYIALTVRCRN